jgi:type II secretory pathway component PulM
MSASIQLSGGTPSLRRQDRRALFVGAIALVALLGYSRVARPALETMRAEQRTLGEQEALLARERSLVAAAPALPRARQDVNRALAAEATRLFAGDSVAATAELSAYVSQIASAAGVHLTTVDGRAPLTTRGLTRLSVDVRGEAAWNQVINFVHLLEASGQLVDVTSVRIERGPRGGPLGGAMVSVAATLAGYSRSAR